MKPSRRRGRKLKSCCEKWRGTCLDFVSVPVPLDGWSGETSDLAVEFDVPLARDDHLGGLDLLDNLGRFGFAHHVQHRVGLGLTSSVDGLQSVLTIVLVGNLKNNKSYNNFLNGLVQD